ncbi:hypothetical protein GUITHDRAFT_108076 [Guillardia theta CCMP2712]|uniref:Uncharacterized protein n=2 Tax=Guillardia theta TaxID=55529 RepID=L1JD59_GUITC|nr:hypothetical protein GUITHDRAFT_108076 [Guillardia theta CCMP2712]EKX46040.1 hypothetical protein GUITHDRAFT_108076 [Guillardia theta CCMP2712]|eukprot:XP_005833020.1 hypothetical protein GUITHDRAFT_108076 [Guillardia theta CCMP2712]
MATMRGVRCIFLYLSLLYVNLPVPCASFDGLCLVDDFKVNSWSADDFRGTSEEVLGTAYFDHNNSLMVIHRNVEKGMEIIEYNQGGKIINRRRMVGFGNITALSYVRDSIFGYVETSMPRITFVNLSKQWLLEDTLEYSKILHETFQLEPKEKNSDLDGIAFDWMRKDFYVANNKPRVISKVRHQHEGNQHVTDVVWWADRQSDTALAIAHELCLQKHGTLGGELLEGESNKACEERVALEWGGGGSFGKIGDLGFIKGEGGQNEHGYVLLLQKRSPGGLFQVDMDGRTLLRLSVGESNDKHFSGLAVSKDGLDIFLAYLDGDIMRYTCVHKISSLDPSEVIKNWIVKQANGTSIEATVDKLSKWLQSGNSSLPDFVGSFGDYIAVKAYLQNTSIHSLFQDMIPSSLKSSNGLPLVDLLLLLFGLAAVYCFSLCILRVGMGLRSGSHHLVNLVRSYLADVKNYFAPKKRETNHRFRSAPHYEPMCAYDDEIELGELSKLED